MNAKTIIPVLLFAAVIPSVTNAASVAHQFSSGAFGDADFVISDACTFSNGNVDISESTTKDNGPATPVPDAYVSIYSYDSCTGEYHYWSPSSTSSITFSHTPATHNSFPHTVSGSGDLVLTDSYTGNTKRIHFDLKLASVGGQYESIYSSHREFPSFNNNTMKSDYDNRSHLSSATGSLTISGDFQYDNDALSNGDVGVGTLRIFTVTH